MQDIDVAKKALQDFGDEGEQALKRLQAATIPASTGLQALNVISVDFKNKVKDLSDQAGTFGKVLSTFGPLGQTAAAGIGLFAAAFAVSSLTNFTKQSFDAAEQIGILGERFGISTESMSAFSYIATSTGTNIESFAAGIKNMENNINKAADGTGNAAKAFTGLGLSFQDLKDESPEQQFITILDSISHLSTSSQQTAALVAIFGKNAADLAPAMKLGADGIQALVDKAKNLGIIVSDEEFQKIKNFNQAWKDTSLTMQGAVRSSFLAVYDAIGSMRANYNLLVGDLENIPVDRIKAKIQELQNQIQQGLNVRANLAQGKLGAGIYQSDDDIAFKTQEIAELQAQLDKIQAAAKNAGDGIKDFNAALDAQKIADYKAGLDLEIQQLQQLNAANDNSADSYNAVKEQIDAENAVRQAGIDIGSVQGQQLVAEALQREKLKQEIQDTTDARKEEVDLENKLQEMLNKRIRDTQGLTSNQDKNNTDLQQVLDGYLKTHDALTDQEQAEVDLIKQQNALYAEQKQYVDQVNKTAEEYVKIGESIKSTLASDFDQILKTGKLTWQSLGNSLVDVIEKAASQAAADLIFQPIIAPLIVSAAGAISGADVASATAQKLGIAANGASGLSNFLGLGNSGISFSGITSAVNNWGAANLGTANVSSSFVGPLLPGQTAGLTLIQGLTGGGIGSFGASLVGLGNSNPLINTGAGIAGGVATAALLPELGPLAPIAGGFIGSAISGLFGGGKHHVASSFDADLTPAGLENVDYKADNTTTDAVKQIAAQFTSYIQQLASIGVDPTGDKVTTQLSPEANRFILNGQSFNFDPSDANSVNDAFSDLFKQILATAKITNTDLANALQKVNTEGKTFAEVVQEIDFEENTLPQLVKQAQLQVNQTQLQQAQSQIQLLQSQAGAYQQAEDKWQSYADSLNQDLNNLLLDTNLSPLSPEERLQQAREDFSNTATLAESGNETAIQNLQSSGQALLTASKDYYASSEGYFQDFDLVKEALDQTSSYAQTQVNTQSALLATSEAQLAAEQQQSDLLQQLIDKATAGTQSGPWSQIPDSELLRPGENPADLNAINPNNNISERLVREMKVLAGFDFTNPSNVGISFAQAVKAGTANGTFFNQLIAEVGGTQQQFATGGLVTGGIAGRDSVRALLTPGEFVLTPQATQRIGIGNLNALNTGISPANDNSILSAITALRGDIAVLIRVAAASGDINKDGFDSLDSRLAGIQNKARLAAAA